MTSSPQPVALITAGAAGIGAVLAHAFIESGDAVHVCDRDAKALEAFLAATPGASGSLAVRTSAAKPSRDNTQPAGADLAKPGSRPARILQGPGWTAKSLARVPAGLRTL